MRHIIIAQDSALLLFASLTPDFGPNTESLILSYPVLTLLACSLSVPYLAFPILAPP